MNVHPDMLRQGVLNMHQGSMNQGFLPQQPQQGQQPNTHNLGLLQNNQGGNPGLGIMGGQPSAANPGYQLAMQRGVPQRAFMPSHPNGPGVGAGPSHMSGIPPNQLQNMQFTSAGMMPQQGSLRRVQSQPLGQPGAHMAGMQPGLIGGGMLTGPPQMGGGMRATMTGPQQQLHMQMRQHQQGQTPEHMLPMNRAGHMQGTNPMPGPTRVGTGQPLMSSLSQQSTLSQSHGMQQPMQHNVYANQMALQHQHQQSQHVGVSGQPQPNLSGAMTGNPMASQATGGRAQMSSDMFMPFQNPPMQPQLSHNVPRMPMSNMNNPTYNVAPSPSPMNPVGDLSQRGNGSVDGGPLTPAQVIGMSNGTDGFGGASYGMPQAPPSAPPRPPSHNGPHAGFPMSQSQPNLSAQQSPRQPDRHPNQMHPGPGPVAMQRPQSQPQVAHRQSPIPPNPSRTPRLSQPPLPVNSGTMMPPTRVSTAGPTQSPQAPSHPPAQPPASAPPTAHPNQPASRHPPGGPAPFPAPVAGPSTNHAPPPAPPGQASAPAEGNQTAPAPSASIATIPTVNNQTPPIRPHTMYPVGFGQALQRILQFSGHLSSDSIERLTLQHWQNAVRSYFTEKATMKLTLWKDNQQVEAKPFEIGYPIFPRFFLVTAQSGVKSQSINIDGARERIVNSSRAVVECANASWTFRYTNGYHITLRGPFTAEVVVYTAPRPVQTQTGAPVFNYTLMFERLQFDAFCHDKYLALDSIQGERIPDSPRMMASPAGNQNGMDESRYDEPRYLIDRAVIPAEPINAFGIPQATMRCLELAESVAQMSDLIQFSITNKMGPVDALSAFADKIRRSGHPGPNGMDMFPGSMAGPSSHPDGMNGLSAGTSGPPSSFTGAPGNAPGPSHGSLGTSSPSSQLDGVSKQGKTAPQQTQASGSTPAQASTPASAPTPGGSTTPSMSHASLKRKNPPSQRTGEDSPTTANAEQQSAKRPNRKRGRTGGSS